MGAGLVIAGVCAVGAAGLLWWRSSEKKKLGVMNTLQTTPVAKLSAAVPGTQVELKGKLRTAKPVMADFSREPAVWFLARVDEKRERTVNGKKQTHTSEIQRNEAFADIMLEDASGQVPFDLRTATIEGFQTVDRKERKEVTNLGEAAGLLVLGSLAPQHHFIEHLIRPDTEVYALATALPDGRAGADPAGRNRFFVSVKSEDALAASSESTMKWLLMSAVVLISIAVVALIIGLS